MSERIELTDTVLDVVQKLSEGNPGAVNVCAQLLEGSPNIDPDGAMGGVGALLMLDSLGIYGSRIWVLYKDVCGQELPKTIALLRAWQLGFVTKEKLLYAVDNRGAGIEPDDLLQQVQERLPNFWREEAVPAKSNGHPVIDKEAIRE